MRPLLLSFIFMKTGITDVEFEKLPFLAQERHLGYAWFWFEHEYPQDKEK